MPIRNFTAIVESEDDGHGDTVEQATANLKEAVELFLECASPDEVERPRG